MPGNSSKDVVDLLKLRQRFERARLAHSRLAGMRAATQAREADLVLKVGHAKGRLSLVEETDAVLDGLQRLAHERSVGVFERLLSAITADVLPDIGKVKLELGMERNLPALHVKIQNGEALEDVLSGSGGSANNIVVAGLRFIALSRTQNRRFIVLDEPDCWLQPQLLPAFARVLVQVAERTNTQTLLVSHHDASYFEGLVNLVRIIRESKDVPTKAHPLEPRVSNWKDNETPGIRAIQLIDFRTYADATIPLSPGITALVGNNDIGKSHAAAGALRAVAYGDSDEDDIRHGADEAKVIITLEGSRRIEWVRRRKGSPIVTYELFQGDTSLHRGRPVVRGQVPEWVTQYLGISRINGLDIQIGSQKDPVALLNLGPSNRAQLLAVGRESERLHALIDRYGELKRKDRELVRDGEAEIAELRRRIESSTNIVSLDETLDQLTRQASALEGHSARTVQLGKFLARVDLIAAREARFLPQAQLLRSLPEKPPSLKETRLLGQLIPQLENICARQRRFVQESLAFAALPARAPALHDLRMLGQLVQRIEHATCIFAAKREYPPITTPVLKDLNRLRDLGTRIATLLTGTRLKPLPPLPAANIMLKDTAVLGRLGMNVVAHQASLTEARNRLARVKAEESVAEQSLQQMIEAMGGVCPTCMNPLPDDFKTTPHTHHEGCTV